MTKAKTTWLALASLSAWGTLAAQDRKAPDGENGLIPPATPLIACDPYFSIWSPADELTGAETTHWTGRRHQLTSLVKIDDKSFRIIGMTPASLPAMTQTGLSVHPTQTQYQFEHDGVALTVTFTTPALPEDMTLLSRPVTYVSYDFASKDDKNHEVSVFFGASGEVAVNETNQAVTWNSEQIGDMTALRIGSVEQNILGKKGDDLRIDWGYFYLASPTASGYASARPNEMAYAFASNSLGKAIQPGRADQADSVGIGLQLKTLPLPAGGKASTWLMAAYDDLWSIQFNHKNLRPYWRKDGWEAKDLLAHSADEYASLRERCDQFDQELTADLEAMGGVKFAKICALAYRQCFAAGKFVADENGQPLQFSKENHSNGCIATSDVFYPMAPQFLLFGPTVGKSFIVPFMEYAMSDRWKFDFAPHDLGTYPWANGQVYGGGEETEENQMPVEECGNLLCLFGAISEMEGHAEFATKYWSRLEQWANYLKKEGYDPPNQLCTDDFAGHMAHNVNLSAKAICGLGAFAKMCDLKGEQAKAKEFSDLAKDFAGRWVKEAKDGDHYRLAFDREGTWSQKYNLVWDRILGLGLFPDEVLETEMAYYKSIQNKYGLPLDNRSDYTKLDWILWTATLTQDREDFEALVAPVFAFLNATPDRSPMTDWYFTSDARKRGFTARPVVGGVFLQALYDDAIWKKYASRDVTKAKDWAPLPEYIPPVVTSVVPNATEDANIVWRYTTEQPADGWEAPGFDAGQWQEGKAGFGSRGTPNARLGTRWNTNNIWLRREFTLESVPENLALSLHHDEDAKIYLNGVLACSAGGYNTSHEIAKISDDARAALKPGKNTIAIHCVQRNGGQYIDAGLITIEPGKK